MYTNIPRGSVNRNKGMSSYSGHKSFENILNSAANASSSKTKGSIQKVQKNLHSLASMRGKHDEWSKKDVPLKLLRKPTNFSFLYNHSAMANFFNSKMAQEQKVREACRNINKKVNTSYENFDNLKDVLKSSNQKYGTLSAKETKEDKNRSFDIYDNCAQTYLRENKMKTPTVRNLKEAQKGKSKDL